jgi:uncharacterized protein YjiS (DUF1127 family)
LPNQAASKTVPSARAATSLLKGDVVMMEESLQRKYRLPSLDHRGYEPRRTVGSSSTTAIALVLPLTRRAPRRAGMGHIAPLTAIRQIVAAIRRWRGRARPRQELCELDDHLLKDIGLRREEVGYDFPTLFSHCD